MGLFSYLVRFFEGRVGIVADRKNKNALLSFFVNNGISAKTVPYGDEGGIYTEISPGILKNIAPALDKLNIMVYINNIYGFKRLCSRYARRYGLWLGAVSFAFLLWLSTLFVWRVDIVGADGLPREKVRTELSEMGVKVGALISDIEKTDAVNAFLANHPEISWAAINFKGTTAELVLRETESKPDTEDKEKANLLVAAEDGIVRGILVYEGVAVVKEGTAVKRGDVLISGFVSGSGAQITEAPILRVTSASGTVKAEVTRFAEVTVPFEKQVTKICSGEKKVKVLSVFGRDIAFGSTDGMTKESERYVTFFGVIEIPVTVKTYSEQRTETYTETCDPEMARLTAEKTLYKQITERLSDAELVRVKTEFTETENGVIGYAEIVCTAEIAVPYSIKINNEREKGC